MAKKQGFVLAFCKAIRVKYFMLCKSLRSTLNALLQATMLRIRATNRTTVGYVRYARFPQMQALASLFACGQPLKTTHRVVFLTLSFKSLLLSDVKQKRTSEFACPFCLAEKQGFEPWLRFSRTTPLAGEPLRPLGYFSLNRKRIIKDA